MHCIAPLFSLSLREVHRALFELLFCYLVSDESLVLRARQVVGVVSVRRSGRKRTNKLMQTNTDVSGALILLDGLALGVCFEHSRKFICV